jgi:hypothetical protein
MRTPHPKNQAEQLGAPAKAGISGRAVRQRTRHDNVTRRALAGIQAEKEIQRTVINTWRKLGRPNTLVAAIPNSGAMWQSGLTAGLSDLLVLGPNVPGRAAFLELKALDGTPSQAQRDFQVLCHHLGVLCEIVYGADAALRLLQSWGVVLPYIDPAHGRAL